MTRTADAADAADSAGPAISAASAAVHLAAPGAGRRGAPGAGRRGALRAACAAGGAGAPFAPVRIDEIELAKPVPDVFAGTGTSGVAYGAARILVRLHGIPLGTIEVPLPRPDPSSTSRGRLPAQALASAIAERLHAPLTAHLRADGLLHATSTAPDAAVLQAMLARGLPDRLPGGAAPPCEARTALGPQAPLVSVVIATYRRPALLACCVDSVLAGDYPQVEVVVVDNCPSDPATRAAIGSRYGTDPRVRYVAEPTAGTSQARNTGVAVASGEIVAFTDDDVTVDRQWLRALVATLAANPRAGCVTGMSEPAALETPAQVSFERFGGFVGGYEGRTFSLTMDPRPTRLFPFVLGIAGATNNMAMRATTARAMRFDTRLGPGTPTLGGEDLDLIARILLSGRDVVYEPSALAHHEHRSDGTALRRQAFGYGAGATAVVAKWLVVDRRLRQALWHSGAGVLRTALIGETQPDAPREARVPVRVRVHQLAGYVAGPALWARSAHRSQRP